MATVVVLTLLVTIFGLQARQLVRARRQLMMEERGIQLGWLAESGLERAAMQLRGDGSYRGELWEISGAELGRTWDVVVRIGVRRSAGREGFLVMEAVAEERMEGAKGWVARREAVCGPMGDER